MNIIRKGHADTPTNSNLQILAMMGLPLFDDIFEKAESGPYTLAEPSDINLRTIAHTIEHSTGLRVDQITLVSTNQPTEISLGTHFGTLLLERLERQRRVRLLSSTYGKELFKHAYIGIEPPNFGWLFNECMHTMLFSLIYTFYMAGVGIIGTGSSTHHLRTCLEYCIPVGQHADRPTTWYVACA